MFQRIREELEYLDERQRVRIFSYIAGAMVGLAWWIFIDACATTKHFHPDAMQVKAQLYMPGIGATLAFFIIAFMDWGALGADEYSYHGGRAVAYQARGLLVFAVLLALACIGVSGWVLSNIYMDKIGIKGIIPANNYGGFAMLIQCILIFLASFVIRLGRSNEN